MPDSRIAPRPPASQAGFAGVDTKVKLDRMIEHQDALARSVERIRALTHALAASQYDDRFTPIDVAALINILEEEVGDPALDGLKE